MRSTAISLIRLAVLHASALVVSLSAASVNSPPPHAPPFDLPLIAASGYLRSTDVYAASEYTFLVFWDSECPHCVESLVASDDFYDEHGGDEVSVVGIHTGQGDVFEAQRLIETHGVRYPQLQDVAGETAAAYSVGAAEFTLVLVSRDGRVLQCRSDPRGDVKGALNEMLASARSTPPVTRDESGVASTSAVEGPEIDRMPWGFVVHGDERIRFLSIDQQGEGAVGPYGETLDPGNVLLYRFDFDISRRLTRHLRVGALLRIGNEDERVLELGPEYLGTQWGSAFAEVNAGGLEARLGYYEIFVTPFTLMRWDWDDNPRIGGNAGCGCGAAAGVLLIESLEELDPEIVFEGGAASFRKWGLETRAFYAIPRRADETPREESVATGKDRASYSLETAGIEAKWRRLDSRTGSTWAAGLRLVGAWEDDRSVDFVDLGYPFPDPFTSSAIVTADWSIPVVRHLDLEGEWILWNEAEEDAQACCDTTLTSEGEGGIAGLVFERAPGWKVRFDYMYLDAGFYSPFAALSYTPNREGSRASLEIPLHGREVLASFFYKRFREIEAPYAGADKLRESFLGASLDAEWPVGVGGSVGWLENSASRQGSVEPTDDLRRALVITARYRFQKAATVQAEYQWLERETTAGGLDEESTACLYSVYMTVRF